MLGPWSWQVSVHLTICISAKGLHTALFRRNSWHTNKSASANTLATTWAPEGGGERLVFEALVFYSRVWGGGGGGQGIKSQRADDDDDGGSSLGTFCTS